MLSADYENDNGKWYLHICTVTYNLPGKITVHHDLKEMPYYIPSSKKHQYFFTISSETFYILHFKMYLLEEIEIFTLKN